MCSFVGFVSSISPDCKRDTLKVGVNPELDHFLRMKDIYKKKKEHLCPFIQNVYEGSTRISGLSSSHQGE